MKAFSKWVAWLSLSMAALSGTFAANRPNIVFLFSDDQRADTIGAWGNENISTPNLDELARRGSSFTRTYCMGSMQGAVCVPSRAMLMTGRSLFRATTAPTAGQIPKEAVTWPEHFRKAGYKTIGIGKWHNDRPSYARSFSDGGPVFFGGMSDQFKVPVQPYDPAGKHPNEARVIGTEYSTALFANAAVSFLERQTQDEPFLMYVAFTVPHDPRTSPEAAAARYDAAAMVLPANYMPEHPFDNGEMKIRDEALLPWPREREAIRGEIASYYAMITHLDQEVGRIVKTLEAKGLLESTLLVFASDHGLALGSHGLLGKQNLYEHSVRAPLIMAGPGVPANQRFDALCYLYDLYPTFCDLAGLPTPGSVEGRSLSPVLRGETRTHRPAIFTAYKDVQRSVRNDRYKLIAYPKISHLQLFDLKNDPDELRNLAEQAESREMREGLLGTLRQTQIELGDPLVKN